MPTISGGSSTYPRKIPTAPGPLLPPYTVACEQRDEQTFVCRDLAGAKALPVHTPLYALNPNSDWVETPVAETSGQDYGEEYERLLEAV